MSEVPDTKLTLRQRKGLALAKRAAGNVLQRRLRLYRLARSGYVKLRKNETSLNSVYGDLVVLVRLARAWAKKEYRSVPWKTMLYATAALIYFVNPVDAIPDALLGVGFVDDIAVITAVVSAIRRDLERFRLWEAAHK